MPRICCPSLATAIDRIIGRGRKVEGRWKVSSNFLPIGTNMPDVSDSNREFKFEVCTQFAAGVKERIPSLPFSLDYVRDQLLRDLELELIQDEIDRVTNREVKDDLARRLGTLAFGHLISFAQPVEELVKMSRQKRRIVNALITVTQEYELYAADLLETPFPTTGAITNHYSRWAERSSRARRTALFNIACVAVVLVIVTWLAVLLTSLDWVLGLSITLGLAAGGWCAFHRFDPYDHI
jgi:hypothetical protein